MKTLLIVCLTLLTTQTAAIACLYQGYWVFIKHEPAKQTASVEQPKTLTFNDLLDKAELESSK